MWNSWKICDSSICPGFVGYPRDVGTLMRATAYRPKALALNAPKEVIKDKMTKIVKIEYSTARPRYLLANFFVLSFILSL